MSSTIMSYCSFAFITVLETSSKYKINLFLSTFQLNKGFLTTILSHKFFLNSFLCQLYHIFFEFVIIIAYLSKRQGNKTLQVDLFIK